VWDYSHLNEFIASPRDYAPGTKMTFGGLRKVQDRADLVAWLRTLSDDPAPLPSAEDIAAAARAAQADDFIGRLPDGYDSILGQRGINLSGGQKQRLSIARALLLQPSLLILDDSTSAVDLATEARILGGIRALLPRTTCLLIAQRLSAAAAADLVVVLEQGRVVTHGTHAQLLESSAAYRDIHRSQAAMGTVSHD